MRFNNLLNNTIYEKKENLRSFFNKETNIPNIRMTVSKQLVKFVFNEIGVKKFFWSFLSLEQQLNKNKLI